MVIFFHRFVIGYEERTLRRRFAYAGYVQRAPRRIPHPPRVAEPHPQMGAGFMRMPVPQGSGPLPGWAQRPAVGERGITATT